MRCLWAETQILLRSSRRAIKCTVISVFSQECFFLSHCLHFIELFIKHLHTYIFGVIFVVLNSSLHCSVKMLFILAINGRMYGNLGGLEMCAGDKVIWYTFGLGTEVDIHGVFFEGNTFKKQSTTRDTLNLFPHTTASVAMQPNTPGQSNLSGTCTHNQILLTPLKSLQFL